MIPNVTPATRWCPEKHDEPLPKKCYDCGKPTPEKCTCGRCLPCCDRHFNYIPTAPPVAKVRVPSVLRRFVGWFRARRQKGIES